MAPFITPWSVSPIAGWPKAAARSTSESILAAPSSSEYSEWTCRCTAGPCGIEAHYGVGLGPFRARGERSPRRAEKRSPPLTRLSSPRGGRQPHLLRSARDGYARERLERRSVRHGEEGPRRPR